jgi:hypothetical protein
MCYDEIMLKRKYKIMQRIPVTLLCAFIISGCVNLQPSKADLATLTSEFKDANVVVDTDCIFSAPVYNKFIAYRHFGLCLFGDTRLNLYHAGKKPSLAYAWQVGAIKSYAFHIDTFTLVTDKGNFGLVVRDSDKFIAVLHARGIPENTRLPVFRTSDEAPSHWMF